VEIPANRAALRRIAPRVPDFVFDRRDRIAAVRLDVALRRRPRAQVRQELRGIPLGAKPSVR
jgi:hypothetical protein